MWHALLCGPSTSHPDWLHCTTEQDVERIEREGPRLKDLRYTHVLREGTETVDPIRVSSCCVLLTDRHMILY